MKITVKVQDVKIEVDDNNDTSILYSAQTDLAIKLIKSICDECLKLKTT